MLQEHSTSAIQRVDDYSLNATGKGVTPRPRKAAAADAPVFAGSSFWPAGAPRVAQWWLKNPGRVVAPIADEELRTTRRLLRMQRMPHDPAAKYRSDAAGADPAGRAAARGVAALHAFLDASPPPRGTTPSAHVRARADAGDELALRCLRAGLLDNPK
jgi:hypothetical protein